MRTNIRPPGEGVEQATGTEPSGCRTQACFALQGVTARGWRRCEGGRREAHRVWSTGTPERCAITIINRLIAKLASSTIGALIVAMRDRLRAFVPQWLSEFIDVVAGAVRKLPSAHSCLPGRVNVRRKMKYRFAGRTPAHCSRAGRNVDVASASFAHCSMCHRRTWKIVVTYTTGKRPGIACPKQPLWQHPVPLATQYQFGYCSCDRQHATEEFVFCSRFGNVMHYITLLACKR